MSHSIGRLDGPTQEALVELGKVLRELRTERGLSQRALAGRCGLSQATISRLETGQAEGTRVAWLARLLAGLDVQVRVLPDDRHLLDRSRGFRLLRQRFDRLHGDARARAREVERKRNLDYIFALSLDEDRRRLERADDPLPPEPAFLDDDS
jgi:transcriptional regulator with XRE-family HTH domain